MEEVEADVVNADTDWFAPPPSRRRFLAMLAGTVSVTALGLSDGRASAAPIVPVVDPSNFDLRLTRTKDLIDVRLRFRNLRVATVSGAKRVVKYDVTKPSFLVVEFEPQHVAEEALYMSGETPTSAQGAIAPTATGGLAGYSTGAGSTLQHHRRLPLRSRIASPSRLVFTVSPSLDFIIPYTTAGLLNWSNPAFSPTLVPAANRGRAVDKFGALIPLVEPSAFQTAIEFPYGMVITPTPSGRWASRTAPVTRSTRTEVWSTALIDGVTGGAAALRAVWTTENDYVAAPIPPAVSANTASPNPGFITLPTQNDKYQLVRKTTDRSKVGLLWSEAPTLTAHKFRMSALGATADISGQFTAAGPLDLEAYVHRAFAGRDVYVKVVTAGYLYPTGHRASQVRVTERVFAAPSGTGAATGPVAYLQEFEFLVVRERTRTFLADGADETNITRGFPFTKVTIHTEASPPMTPAALGSGPGVPAINIVDAFLPIVAGDCFRFDSTVTDKLGREHRVKIPLAFVRNAFPKASWPSLKANYDLVPEARRSIKLDGLRIGFAPELPGMEPGSTSFPTSVISMFGVPSFSVRIPSMDFAGITLETMRGFAGSVSDFAFTFPKMFLDLGFDGLNSTVQVFAAFIPKAGFGSLDITFPDLGSLGALASPNFSLSGLSAALGSFGGNFPQLGFPDILDGSTGNFAFDPTSWFSGLPQLFGGIDLTSLLDLLPSIPSFDPQLPSIPGFSTSVVYDDLLGQRIPVGLTISYRWCTDKLKSVPETSGDEVFLTSASPNWVGGPASGVTTLCIEVTVTVKLAVPKTPSIPEVQASASAAASLNEFQISLFGSGTTRFVVIDFASITFAAHTGADPQVTPNIRAVNFDGALNFIKTLAAKLLPEGGLLGGGGGGGGGGSGLDFSPIFDVDTTHVAAGFELGIPTLSVGVFSLGNLRVGMLLTVPFDDQPLTAAFHVSRAESPFLITVGFLGGGGFFELEVGVNGVRRLEISLEFGAAVQLDLGIASGNVSVMAGIHFMVKSEPDLVELQGYFRLNGRVEVLGIITLSAEVLLSLTYVSPPGVAKGRAMVSFTIEIAFFSTTVSTEVEKTFAGGDGGAAPAALRAASAALPVGPMLAPAQPTIADFMTVTDWGAYVGAFGI